MPYDRADFRRAGVYIEKPESEHCDLEDGKIIKPPRLPDHIHRILQNPGGSSHGGDPSRQDSAVISLMLRSGNSPADIYTTFIASPRGRDADGRKPGHLEDYVRRTIEAAQGYVSSNGHKRVVTIDFSEKSSKFSESGLIVRKASEFENERQEWIWPSYIPAGTLTILAGEPGAGKSTIAYDLIARITRGFKMPCGHRGAGGVCMIATAEDNPEKVVRPRLVAANADLDRVVIIDSVWDSEDDNKRLMTFPRDLPYLRAHLIKSVKLIVVDPINAFLSGNIDSHNDQSVRSVLYPLEQIAQETGTAILAIMHNSKRTDGNAMTRISGSTGYVAAARSVLGVGTTEDKRTVFFPIKNNLAKKPSALSYEIKPHNIVEDDIHTSKIKWLGAVEFDPNGTASDKKGTTQACQFLQEALKDGEMEWEAILESSKQMRINRPDLSKARIELNIVSINRKGKWFWELPK